MTGKEKEGWEYWTDKMNFTSCFYSLACHTYHPPYTALHLPFNEQFEAIQNQVRQDAIADSAEHAKKTVSLTNMALKEVIPKFMLL